MWNDPKRKLSPRRYWVAALAAALLTFSNPISKTISNKALAQEPSPTGKSQSDLQLPRFVSLKADRVNVRNGPGKDHGVKWIYRRTGLPVEIFEEYDHWRRIRDADGADGWVFYRLLSKRRTALITPWPAKNGSQQTKRPTPILASPSKSGSILVQAESGVLVSILKCDTNWCRVSLGNYRGWVEKEKLWGVYPNENVD